MRVITGAARGRNLMAPPGLDTRPTAQMVKEALFSIIQFEVEGARVLDLFAGSGQLGIEALSRGAASCVFVDSGKKCQQVIRENLTKTGLSSLGKVYNADCISWMKGNSGPFDIAFIDPPYGAELMEPALKAVAELMGPGSAVFCESDLKVQPPQTAGSLIRQKEYRYGKTKITLYRPAEA